MNDVDDSGDYLDPVPLTVEQEAAQRAQREAEAEEIASKSCYELRGAFGST